MSYLKYENLYFDIFKQLIFVLWANYLTSIGISQQSLLKNRNHIYAQKVMPFHGGGDVISFPQTKLLTITFGEDNRNDSFSGIITRKQNG